MSPAGFFSCPSGLQVKNTFLHCDWDDSSSAPVPLRKSKSCPAELNLDQFVWSEAMVCSGTVMSLRSATYDPGVCQSEQAGLLPRACSENVLPPTPPLHVKNTFIHCGSSDRSSAPPPLQLLKSETCPPALPAEAADACVGASALDAEDASTQDGYSSDADACFENSKGYDWPETPSSHWELRRRDAFMIVAVPVVGSIYPCAPVAKATDESSTQNMSDDCPREDSFTSRSVSVKRTFIHIDVPDTPRALRRSWPKSCPAAPSLKESIARFDDSDCVEVGQAKMQKHQPSRSTELQVRRGQINHVLTSLLTAADVDASTSLPTCLDSLPIESAEDIEFALHAIIAQVVSDARCAHRAADVISSLRNRFPGVFSAGAGSEFVRFTRILCSVCQRHYDELLRACGEEVTRTKGRTRPAAARLLVALLVLFGELFIRRRLPLQAIEEIFLDMFWPDAPLPDQLFVECGCILLVEIARSLEISQRGTDLLSRVLSRLAQLKDIVSFDGALSSKTVQPQVEALLNVHVGK